MVSLVDIVPQTRTVRVNGGEIELRGLGLRQIAGLLVRYPELRKLLVAGAPALDLDVLIEIAPDAVGTLIAEAAGQPEAADKIAEALPLEEVAECLFVVGELTMPNGPAPFFDRLNRFLGARDDRPDPALPGKGPDTNTPPSPSD